MASNPIPSENPRAHSNRVPPASKPRTTRTGMVWAAVIVALLALLLLIIFLLQNQQPARILFLGLDATIPLSMAMFISAVAGGILVAAAGAARIIQLRSNAHRIRTGRNRK